MLILRVKIALTFALSKIFFVHYSETSDFIVRLHRYLFFGDELVNNQSQELLSAYRKLIIAILKKKKMSILVYEKRTVDLSRK